MSFSEKQARALTRTVPPRHIRTRVRDGKELSYVEGWFAIAEANRIFGFDGWDRETLEAKCVLTREARGSHLAVYTVKVRLTVRTQERSVVREGHGTGEGRGNSAGEAHDVALKVAETDATKRALVTFGKAFGLALYAHRSAKQERMEAELAPFADPRSMTSADGELTSEDLTSRADRQSDDSRDATDQGPRRTRSADGATNTSVASLVDHPSEPLSIQFASGNSQRGIDKSALAFGEPRRVRDKVHLRYVGAQPCLLCSARPADPHHLRFAQVRALGRKVSDEFTVPLCRKHHREVHHSGNEAAWWHDMGIDPIEIARELWEETRRLTLVA